MQIFRQVTPRCLLLRNTQLHGVQSRHAHDHKSSFSDNSSVIEKKSESLSLLDELFPEEKDGSTDARSGAASEDLPSLELPRLDVEKTDYFEDGTNKTLNEASRNASFEAQRKWNLAVLIVGKSSKSLVDSDFRRIAPKGRHIDGWTGLGDILKST